MIIGIWLLAASLVVAGEAIQSRRLADIQIEWPDRSGLGRMLGIAAACLVFISVMNYVGDLVAGVLTILLVLRVMGMKRWWHILPTAILMAAVTHWLFSSFLGVPLPPGRLFG